MDLTKKEQLKEALVASLLHAIGPYEAFESEDEKSLKYKARLEEAGYDEEALDSPEELYQEFYDDLHDDFHNCGGSVFGRMTDFVALYPYLNEEGQEEILYDFAEFIIEELESWEKDD